MAASRAATAGGKDYITKLFKNVPVLGAGARDATTTFAQRGIGDVLLSWENEAYLTIDEFGPNFDIVYPSSSILAEPPVALLDKNVDRHKTRVAGHRLPELPLQPARPGPHRQAPLSGRATRRRRRSTRRSFKQIPLVTIDQAFGGWKKAQAVHFADGGLFDQIYKPT